jgi:hypothetical protein
LLAWASAAVTSTAAMSPVVVFSPKPILGSFDLHAIRDCQPH